jgi:hypothetical protein
MSEQVITIVGPALAAAAIFGVYYWLQRRRSQGVKKKLKDTGKGNEPNCLVMDIKTRSYGPEFIKEKQLIKLRDGPTGLGRQWYYGLQSVYWLVRDLTGKLSPVEVPQTLEHPPGELWEALQQEDAEIIFDMTKEQHLLEKYAPYLVMFGISFFALIVFVTQGG